MITFPSVIWAFNPTFITITNSSESAGRVTISVDEHSFTTYLYNGDTKIDISRLVQLCFDSPSSVRSKTVTISVSGADTGSASALAIWGVLDIKYASYGQFANNGVRKVHNFVKYPFTIDLLTSNGFETQIPIGNASYTTTSPTGQVVRTEILQRQETEGMYLRWIDRFGFTQYYLFSTGEVSLKSNQASVSIEELQSIAPLSYISHDRPLSVDTESEIKICAVNLDADTLDYVSSIIGSPFVDLYLDDVWVPVRVTDGTYSYSAHHLSVLQDLEITLTLPKIKSQRR